MTSDGVRRAAGTNAASAARGQHGRIAGTLDGVGRLVPFIITIGAILVLMLLPLAGHWYAQPLRNDMRNVAEPGRALVTRLHVAIALEGAALRDYMVTASVASQKRFQDATDAESEVLRQLRPLVQQLGPDVRSRYADLLRLHEQWEHSAAVLRRSPSARTPAREQAAEEYFEDVLIGAARLDESIDAAIRQRQTRIAAAERIQLMLMIPVGALALLAMLLVAWLGRRLRMIAAVAEQGRLDLERAAESRARFIRGMTHDLKNPLNAIDGHAQLLADGIRGPVTPDQTHSLGRIRLAVRSLMTLVEDLLELSRAESGQMQLKRSHVDVREIVTDAIEEHRAAAETKEHRLQVEFDDAVGGIVTDPGRVKQVLGNLLSNAIKYSPPHGKIVVRTRAVAAADGPDANRRLEIEVADSGPGIPEDRREDIFGEFVRLESTSAQPGAGLGLAIARRLAHLLGGDITVEPANGDGAAFTLVLPLDPDSVRSDRPATDGSRSRPLVITS